MIISGFQPLSLLDYPGVVSSIIFTQGCLFRCVYCHNPDLIPIRPSEASHVISEDVVLDTLKRRAHIVEGVCITGGEPTIHSDLPVFIKKIKALGLLVKLDTNGVHPRMIEQCIEERLVDFIAMDLKHVWARYADVIGLTAKNVIDNCQETFRLIQTSSVPHEFRTTVYPALHAQEDLWSIAEQLQDGERYALQAIRYEKTLQADLRRTEALDLEAVAEYIRTKRPDLKIEVRA